MKNCFILLIGLIVLFSMPVFASTPQQENAPAPSSEDTMFLGLEQVSEEELLEIIGDVVFHEENDPVTKDTVIRILIDTIQIDYGITISSSMTEGSISVSVYYSLKTGTVVVSITYDGLTVKTTLEGEALRTTITAIKLSLIK